MAYSHPDHLSTRVETDGTTGAWIRKYGHLPFGEDWYEQLQGAGLAGKLKFTTYQRDSESTLDYALARNFSSRLGRFMQVDPFGGLAENPQSLNGYPYTVNDAVNDVDPSGMLDEATCKALGLLSCGFGGWDGPSIGGGPYFDNAGLWGGGSWGERGGAPECGGDGNGGTVCRVDGLGPGGLYYPKGYVEGIMTGVTIAQVSGTVSWDNDGTMEKIGESTATFFYFYSVPSPAAAFHGAGDHIGPRPAAGKAAYCSNQSDMAVLSTIIPGGQYVFGHDLNASMLSAAGLAGVNAIASTVAQSKVEAALTANPSGSVLRGVASFFGTSVATVRSVASFGFRAQAIISAGITYFSAARIARDTYRSCMD